MKKTLLLLLIGVFFIPVVSWGQLLTEDFTGLTNGNLGTQNSWVQNGSGTDVQVASSSPITYNGTGYPSGDNSYITISKANGIDPHKTFASQSTSTTVNIYYSFLIKVTDAPTTTGDYFFSLRNTANTSYGARIFAKQGSSSSKVLFGISKGSSSADSYSSDFDIGTTYLLVIKYISNSGTLNDQMYLWIYNTDALPTEEPATNTANITHNASNADPAWGAAINAIMIHQRSATNSITASIDGIRVATSWSQAPLPVELTSFTGAAAENGVMLNWETATEVNNYGFEILRSAQNDKWEKIGFVNGHGNSNSPKNYAFTDNTVPAGKVQYRLKQIDFDGKFEYSDIVEVNVDAPNKIVLYQNSPNPFNPTTEIKFALPKNSNVELSIYNMLGEKIQTLASGMMNAGEHKVSFNANNYSSGVYLYKLTTDNSTSIKKMILIK